MLSSTEVERYKLLLRAQGASWEKWGSWTTCSKPCNSGERSRERICSEAGKCSGKDKETEKCNTHVCGTCGYKQVLRYGSTTHCCNEDTSNEQCGNPKTGGRIVGGQDAKSKQWPWLVLFQMTNYNTLCTGSLISKRWVVSAGHCFRNKDTGRDLYWRTWIVHLGVLSIRDTFSTGRTTTSIENVIIHRDHKSPKADIVLVKLARDMTLSAYIHPICLPGREVTPENSDCHVAGWGISDTTVGRITDHLQEVSVHIFAKDVCKKAYTSPGVVQRFKDFVTSTDKFLCAGGKNKIADSCGGDSGAPLVCQRCKSCQWYMSGIVSFGSGKCGDPEFPGVYTEVRRYEDWIKQHTGIYSTQKSC